MKQYNDYTEIELDELYAKLPEVAQDFVYGDIIAEEVANVGKETGLHLDKWQSLNTLVLETLLGIVPSSVFGAEVERRLGTTPDVTEKIVTHMDDEIFSVVRDESVENYSETNEKNVSTGAIYDEAQDGLGANQQSDPYRESADLPHTRGPVITEEKLHIVDELFAPYQPKIKPLTTEDGSVRVPTDETPHAPELFQAKVEEQTPAINTPVSSAFITKEMLEAEEKSGGENTLIGLDKMEDILRELPPLTANESAVNTPNLPTKKQGSKKIKLHIEKGGVGANLKIHIENVLPTQEGTMPTVLENQPHSKIEAMTIMPTEETVKKMKPMDTSHPSDAIPHTPNPHYAVDPYKEIL
jgi:hypothetical protein